MHPLISLGKLLMIMGLAFLVLGLALFLLGKSNFGLIRLPGDIYIKRDGFTFYFPLVSCLLLSLIATLLINIFSRR